MGVARREIMTDTKSFSVDQSCPPWRPMARARQSPLSTRALATVPPASWPPGRLPHGPMGRMMVPRSISPPGRIAPVPTVPPAACPALEQPPLQPPGLMYRASRLGPSPAPPSSPWPTAPVGRTRPASTAMPPCPLVPSPCPLYARLRPRARGLTSTPAGQRTPLRLKGPCSPEPWRARLLPRARSGRLPRRAGYKSWGTTTSAVGPSRRWTRPSRWGAQVGGSAGELSVRERARCASRLRSASGAGNRHVDGSGKTWGARGMERVGYTQRAPVRPRTVGASPGVRPRIGTFWPKGRAGCPGAGNGPGHWRHVSRFRRWRRRGTTSTEMTFECYTPAAWARASRPAWATLLGPGAPKPRQTWWQIAARRDERSSEAAFVFMGRGRHCLVISGQRHATSGPWMAWSEAFFRFFRFIVPLGNYLLHAEHTRSFIGGADRPSRR